MNRIPLIIRIGSFGEQVRALQTLLNSHGAKLIADGDFGPRTGEAVRSFQRDTGLVADGIVGERTWEALMNVRTGWPPQLIDLKRGIDWVPLKDGQFMSAWSRKQQIVLHHTAGGPDAEGVVRWWNTDPSRVATAFVIGANGKVVQCFDDRCWAYHLGSRTAQIDHISVGIELCNWGYLERRADGRFVNYVGGIVADADVVELKMPWRGFKYFHAYTSAQLNATAELVLALAKRWGIAIQDSFGMDWFQLHVDAQAGRAGLWNHVNWRSDKTDVSPQPKLIEMLNSLT